MLITIGIAFIVTDSIDSQKDYFKLSHGNALVIGISQILAFMRGCSRSGVLILAGKLQKLSIKQAAKYSFLAGIPIISAASFYNLLSLSNNELISLGYTNLIIGFTASFITSLISIKLLLSIVQKIGLKYFGLYRIILAIVILIIS